MARTRSEQYPEIQHKILKRAAAVFASVGYASSTISNLADATEISRGALYHYFQSKEAILCGILDDHLLGFLEMLDSAMQPKRTPVQQLRAVSNAIVEFNTRCRDEQVLILTSVNQLSDTDRERMVKMQRKIVDRLSDLLVRVDVAGRITPSNKRVCTMMYLGILNYTFSWFDPNGPMSPAEYADLATDLFLQGLLSKPESRRKQASALPR